ncbi:MAG: helix-turn-helix domain-containing protein [Roseburia sp.]|nr:helix-turn-helix domain-containing protein [Roseburia sp.]MCM1099609.1 helix-turn-helix domain-containing protein [Ruminococcus flavefaciens]
MSNYLLISDAAKEVKVESHVLRYWEEELHLPIRRNELGHRYYTEEDVERFKQIKGMKERGLQLKAIKMILKDGKLDILPSDGKAETGELSASGITGQDGSGEHPENRNRKDAPGQGDAGEYPENRSSREVSGPGAAAEYPEAPTEKGTSEEEQPRNGLAIDIVAAGGQAVTMESREDKSRRLQWLLQQLIRETLQENNAEICREIRDSVVKELDYQFRMQEEREELRDKKLAERDEEYYKKMDELLRRKTRKKLLPERKKKGVR